MKIKGLSIDRYGAWSKLHLSDLDDRINVIYGVNGSGKTTVVRFLQAMLYGFPHFQESAAPAQSSLWGGSVTIEGPTGRRIIRRHDNGTRTGRLTIQTSDGISIDREVLPEMLSGVDESVFRLLFISAYRDAPPTEALVQAALSHGFDLATARSDSLTTRISREEAVRRAEETRREIEQLKDRLRTVHAEMEELERDRTHLSYQREGELRRVHEEIARCDGDVLRLRRELQIIDDELAAWEERQAAQLVLSTAGEEDEELDGQTLAQRRHALQSQLERWQRVQKDVTRRRNRLRREMMGWTANGPATPVALWEEAQRHIDALERRLEQLQSEIRTISQPNAAGQCDCREADARCTPLVRAIRDEVYHLCRELNRHYLDVRRNAITEELHQLRRCRSEVAAHLQRLTRRKERIERELELQNAAIAPTRVRRQEAADRLRRSERELANLHEERRRIEQLPVAVQDPNRLAARRLELETLRREIDQRLERLMATDWSEVLARRLREPEPTPVPSTVMQEASQYLHRITGGQYVRIHMWREDRSLRIEDARGESHALEMQGRPLRDRAHLAICLALVGAYARRGVWLPLILDDAFVNHDAQDVERVAELLCEFAARGHQVFVFTCREQVARVFRRFNAPVLELPAESNVHEQTALRWGAETSPLMVSSASLASAAPVMDDLPPPLSEDPVAPRPRGDARGPRHYLLRTDGVQYAPDLDPAAALELSAGGVATVGDFLALSATAIESRLSPLRISVETIRQWQAMARLMCDTPHLRAFDARILAASGVQSAADLERMSPEELLQRVERCLDTEHGKRLFRMGDDEELARLAAWMGAGRTTQSLRETQKKHWSRRNGAERGWRWYDESPIEGEAQRVNGHQLSARLREPRLEVLHGETPTDSRRFYLELASPVIDAPSIGPRTAERLHAIGVKTVADLLAVSAESAARRMDSHQITGETVREWQFQAELVCTTPRLRGREAQLLVAAGVTSAQQLAACEPLKLWERIETVAASVIGARILQETPRPTLAEVTDWVIRARQARTLHAA